MNLALGSALASIGLTIPAVAVVSIALHQPLELGLDVKDDDNKEVHLAELSDQQPLPLKTVMPPRDGARPIRRSDCVGD
jgi:hypothetical protein